MNVYYKCRANKCSIHTWPLKLMQSNGKKLRVCELHLHDFMRDPDPPKNIQLHIKRINEIVNPVPMLTSTAWWA